MDHVEPQGNNMSHKASMVLTSINNPVLLNGYYENFNNFEHLENVSITVIADKKTPTSAFDTCKELSLKGMHVRIVDIEEQEDFLRKIRVPVSFFPYNSDNRRNIGYLMAFNEGTEFIVSIDDDNHVRASEDFFLEHSVVLSDEVEGVECFSEDGWFNICDLLELAPHGAATYARGYPYYARRGSSGTVNTNIRRAVYVNAGLWLGDPDVDGISWLVNPVHAVKWRGASVFLGHKTWSPINSQNTSMRREAMVAYYFLKMGYSFGGGAIDRYGDIFSGYFLEACAHHLGHGIRFGSPCAQHIRNSHNYLKDAQQELNCIIILEDFLAWLHEVKLNGSTYSETYQSLSYQIEDAVETFNTFAWNDSVRAYFHQMAHYMRTWIHACSTIGN
jgi:hypothetical protein